ncbi:UvrD-helicase domain-containing protein [Stieleria sp. TO1_6]|uniref:UvrD-helicase domain-containing protein n=1 Tax=Stieleria tagensis TaxID=2956795 RepID=UPI00209B4E27|nr:UvrD-helicase domain-containing protein [Stieleria tagensis]MCO8123977.1 UvrD-helicase domain-containing protein [Stieleria tagensis]
MSTELAQPPQDASELFLDGNLPPMLVRASAGTGKTYRLTARLLQILFQGAAPETILATTFTRKAAGEILERILTTLANASDPENPSALDELRRQIGIESLTRNACLQLLKKLIANIHRLRVCTLDSLFTQLAKSFPFELQLPPAWRLTDEIEEIWLRERAIDAVVSMLDPGELATLLSMLSKGETKRSIVRELIQIVSGTYAVARQSDPSVWDQLDSPTRPDDQVLTAAAGTFRMSEPKQKTVRAKLDAMAEILETRQFNALIKETLIKNYVKAKRLGETTKLGRSVLPDGLDDALGALYAAVRSDTLSLLAAQNQATGQVLALYDGQITQLKQSLRTLGFSDIAVRLARQFSGVDHQSLGRRMDGAIDHVLLDEFQDTSPAQWQVLRPFAMRATDIAVDPVSQPDAAVKRSFFCVGDTKQAIYGWRGGVAEIFEAVSEEIPSVHSVEQNKSFRSSPVIMDVVNRIFKNLKRHALTDAASDGNDADKATYQAKAILNFSARFPTHIAEKQSLAGYVRMESCRKVDSRESADKAQACYELAAQRIAELHHQAKRRSIGVLTRTNKGVATLIYLLENLGVDVSQEGGNPLVDSAAVELILSALMMSEHPADGRWKFHVDHSPLAQVDGMSADYVRDLVTEVGIARAVHQLAGFIAPVCDARDTTRLKQLVQLATTYESGATGRLRDFVRMVREKRVERPQAAAVRVMTVHQSKGLEFDAVFLPELDGRLSGQPPLCIADSPKLSEPPTAASRFLSGEAWHFFDPQWRAAFGADAASKMTESMCLLYVAITRARQALYLVVQPCKPDDKKSSALIHAALGNETDLAAGETVLFETGNPNWFA